MMAVRTVVIDRCLMRLIDNGLESVVNLAAGLDTRPYRMALPKKLNWIEADFEGITNYKSERLRSEEPKCNLKRVAIDLANMNQREEFFGTFKDLGKFAVLTEGLLLYLDPQDVDALSDKLVAQPNLQAWITDITTQKAFRSMHQLSTQGKNDSSERVRFTFLPDEGIRYFETRGWKVKEFHNFLEAGRTLNRDVPEELRKAVDEAAFDGTGIGVLTRKA
jgi:methyltransferase (TIGR00027 family)